MQKKKKKKNKNQKKQKQAIKTNIKINSDVDDIINLEQTSLFLVESDNLEQTSHIFRLYFSQTLSMFPCARF